MTGKTYKNLYFDLDRTLWDFPSNSSKTLHELVEKLVPELSPKFELFLSTYHEINEELWRQYRDGEIKKETLRTKRFKDTLEKFGILNHGIAEQMGEDYIKESPYKTILYPNAHETLHHLKIKGYKLYLLTNGFLEVQTIKIRECKLEQYFEKMITSEEAGYQKPNKKIFEYALKTVNAKKSESIMIGDDVENDIQGAKNFGMDTVFFNPEMQNTNIEATFTIKGLRELQSIF